MRGGDMDSGCWTGMKDKNGDLIHEGMRVKGFGHIFTVKWGVMVISKVSPDGSINRVDIPCFYFDNGNGVPVFPIRNNYKGEHDLDTLEIIK